MYADVQRYEVIIDLLYDDIKYISKITLHINSIVKGDISLIEKNKNSNIIKYDSAYISYVANGDSAAVLS